MTGIDGQWGYYRVKGLAKVVFQKLFLLVADFLRPQQMNPFGRKLRQNSLEETNMLFVRKLMDFLRDSRNDRRRGDAVRCCPAALDAPLQTSHPYHKEFIKIGAEDGEKLHALKNRHAWVFGLLQNASVELKPREVTVNQQTLFIFHHGLAGLFLVVRLRTIFF